jgi:excisionase family DNA binding protein
VSSRKRPISKEEIRQAFAGPGADVTPPILSPTGLAALLNLSRKTIDDWLSKGRLDGAFRRRGKHVLIWRDRALDILFNGPDWSHETRTSEAPSRG